MKRLKNLLQYDASKYIHVAIIVGLYILSYRSYIAIILLGIESIYIFKKSKNLLIYSLILIFVITVRINTINHKHSTSPISGTVTEVFEDSFYLKSEGLILCYYGEAERLEPGMSIEINSDDINTRTYQIMNTFDFETYLLSENINQVVSVKSL